MEARERFLNYYKQARSKSTFKSYRRGLDLFEEYFGKSVNESLEMRKEDIASKDFERVRRFEREIEKFHSWLKEEQGYSINSARTLALGIQQFFRFFGTPIVLPPQSKVSETTISTKTFIPSIEELRKMYKVGDLRAKVILSLGLDLAWRIGDFSKLRKEDIPDLNQEAPIKIEKVTEKENVLSSTFISAETVGVLKPYLKTLSKKNPYLFPSYDKGHLKSEALNNVLKKLVEQAKIKIPKNKRVTFHGLRKRFLSTCYSLNIDNEVSRLLVGKSIDKSMEVYLQDVNLKEAFVQVREALSLTNGTVKTEMKDSKIAKLEKENKELRSLIRVLALLNEESITKKVREKLSEKGMSGLHLEEATPYEMLQTLSRLEEEEYQKKQKREYKKLLDEVNNWNHESE